MKKEKSLVEVRNNRNGLRATINNAIEFVKSKVNKDYILSEKSPEFLRRNKKLILKTIKRDIKYLDQVPDDILLEELEQQQLPINGIIDTAFKGGYILGKSSLEILRGEKAKTAILQYVAMQKTDSQKDNVFGRNKLDSQWRISYLLENLNESLLLDVDFREQLLDIAIKNGYRITQASPTHLKQDSRLAEIYYKDLLENNIDNLLNANIISPELLKNRSFLQNYIQLLVQKGIDNDTIVSTLTHNDECVNALKNDLGLFQLVFEQVTPANLEKFFTIFFSNEELKEILTNGENLNGKLLRVSQLYVKDSTILQSLDGGMLKEQYQNIPNYKMQLIAKNPRFQEKILGLNDYEYILYSKMTQLVMQKTDRWNRFEKNIVENLSDGYYGELINDLYEQAKQGNKITHKEIATLVFLFSKHCPSKTFFDEYLKEQYKSQGMDEKTIKQFEARHSDNVFNITNKKELEHFAEIKEVVCDTILTNPNLDDEELSNSISKYLGKFKQLPELDRIKLALLEKYYNMNLSEASNIVSKFSADIDNVPVNNEHQRSIVEQIKAIKNIFESNDINSLKQVGALDILVETDLSLSTYLVEQTKEMLEQLYKENLYMPKEDQKVGTVTYNGKNIEVFNANTDFSMIVKRIGINENNSQKIWNSMTKDGEGGQKDLRYYTCASYMTAENLLRRDNDIEIILGFAQGANNYSFDAMYIGDAHSPFYGGDDIYGDYATSSYMTPSTLEMMTNDYYNEVVINTLGIDEQGQMTKLQPDYVVYIKAQSNVNIENLENEPVWEKTKKVASEFGIPIAVVDKERVKESEKTKIASMSEKLKGTLSSNEALQFVKKVEHYVSRYGIEDILEYASEDKMEFLRNYIEQRQLEERENVSVPNMNTSIVREQNFNDKNNILERQAKLKEENVIDGEEI